MRRKQNGFKLKKVQNSEPEENNCCSYTEVPWKKRLAKRIWECWFLTLCHGRLTENRVQKASEAFHSIKRSPHFMLLIFSVVCQQSDKREIGKIPKKAVSWITGNCQIEYYQNLKFTEIIASVYLLRTSWHSTLSLAFIESIWHSDQRWCR